MKIRTSWSVHKVTKYQLDDVWLKVNSLSLRDSPRFAKSKHEKKNANDQIEIITER